jgi:serine O-acetyltransferase
MQVPSRLEKPGLWQICFGAVWDALMAAQAWRGMWPKAVQPAAANRVRASLSMKQADLRRSRLGVGKMTREGFRELVRADLHRYWGDHSRRAFIRAVRIVPGFRFTYLMRRCAFHCVNRQRVRLLLWRALLNRYRFKYGFDIPHECEIGPGFYLGHFGGVVINHRSRIGRNVNIAQGVTIGQVYRGQRVGTPTIGDRVWIGAHAVVVGGIHVGTGALIAPGAYVTFDVPDSAVVVGNPGQVVSLRGSEGYVVHLLDDVGAAPSAGAST